MIDPTVKSGVCPRCDVAVSAGLGDPLQCRSDTDVGVAANIQLTDAVREAGRGNEWA